MVVPPAKTGSEVEQSVLVTHTMVLVTHSHLQKPIVLGKGQTGEISLKVSSTQSVKSEGWMLPRSAYIEREKGTG